MLKGAGVKRLYLILLCVVLGFNIYGLKPSYPSLNLKRIIDSKIKYILGGNPDSLNIKNEKPYYYSEVSLERYGKIGEDMSHPLYLAMVNYDLAEQYFKNQDFNNALLSYERAFELDPDNYELITYIGSCYRITNRPKLAVKLYKKYLDKYYNYSQLHYFLSSAYRDLGDYKKAENEIIIAHILNRNSPLIKQNLDYLLEFNSKRVVDWDAYVKNYIAIDSAGVHITRDPIEDTLNVDKYSLYLISYNICKALWMTDSLFVEERMVDKENRINLLIGREIDCYLNLLMSDVNADSVASFPQTKAFERSLKEEYDFEFVLYEKILVDEPLIALMINKKGLEKMVEYFKKFKLEKI